MGGDKIKMNQEELDILEQRREELIEYIATHNLMHEKHYMKFVELQDVNLEIIKLKKDYDFSEKEPIKKFKW